MNYENYCEVLAHIERHPEEWRQSMPCFGRPDLSPCCFLGHAEWMGYGESMDSSMQSGSYFLQITPWAPLSDWIFNARRTLDDFRRVRLVLGYARLRAN